MSLLGAYWLLSHFSRVQLCATLWTVAHQAPLSMGFSRQEHWSGAPCPPPGDLPHSGTEPAPPTPPTLQAGSSSLGPPGKPPEHVSLALFEGRGRRSIQCRHRDGSLLACRRSPDPLERGGTNSERDQGVDQSDLIGVSRQKKTLKCKDQNLLRKLGIGSRNLGTSGYKVAYLCGY